MDFGILVDKIDHSQKSVTLVSGVNNVHNIDEYGDVIVFTANYGRSLIPVLFCVLNDYEAIWYDKPLISTCLKTTRKLSKCNSRYKYYYVYDLEWVYNKQDMFELKSLIDSEDIHLIVRSLDHYNLVKRVFKEPVGIISKDFNYEELKRTIAKQYKTS